MLRSTRFQRPRPALAAATVLLAVALVAVSDRAALALITGGEGNEPLHDPGWPKGAAAIFNTPARVAWWEGPPFGGGQWHAECRGDAKALNSVLADFAKLDAKTRRIIVHDGVQSSFWLNPNRDPAKLASSRVDWIFMVWQPASWDRLRQMPLDLAAIDARHAGKAPPAQIDVYTGGNLRWSEVTVPAGLEVVDQRLEAHGFKPADGLVLEGTVVDLVTRQPVAARVQLQRVEPQPKGERHYTNLSEAVADAQGRWVLKNAPAIGNRLIVEAEGYVPRVAAYVQFEDQPGWHSYSCELSRPGTVSGRIADEVAKPLAEVEVRLASVGSSAGGRYEAPHEYLSKTDADGRFCIDQVPVGNATIWLRKSGYCRPGLGQPIAVPVSDVVLNMMKSARARVTVDFAAARRPQAYIVEIEPEGGAGVGKWSGSGNIDANNRISFEDVPPGRYVLRGHPNPSSSSQGTNPLAVDLKGGQTTEISLPAK